MESRSSFAECSKCGERSGIDRRLRLAREWQGFRHEQTRLPMDCAPAPRRTRRASPCCARSRPDPIVVVLDSSMSKFTTRRSLLDTELGLVESSACHAISYVLPGLYAG